eukprot:Amastigsp_a1258_11.p2 type:complete len:237 gc:universal Amastigsp_a1258_11:243-953(+)
MKQLNTSVKCSVDEDWSPKNVGPKKMSPSPNPHWYTACSTIVIQSRRVSKGSWTLIGWEVLSRFSGGGSDASASAPTVSRRMFAHNRSTGASGDSPRRFESAPTTTITSAENAPVIWNVMNFRSARKIPRPHSMATRIVAKLSSRSTTSEVSVETCAPVLPRPTATPAMSMAWRSSTESPVITTQPPLPWMSRTRRSLSAGVARESTVSDGTMRLRSSFESDENVDESIAKWYSAL